jgi:hypothetical protein
VRPLPAGIVALARSSCRCVTIGVMGVADVVVVSVLERGGEIRRPFRWCCADTSTATTCSSRVRDLGTDP